MAQWVEHSPNLHRALDFSLSTTQTRAGGTHLKSQPWGNEDRESEVQGHSLPHKELKASLDGKTLCQRKGKEEKEKEERT